MKDWTLPVAIVIGSTAYLVFRFVPELDKAGDVMGRFFDFIFPLSVFFTLVVTFCKVDFHQMRPHRWHFALLVAQILLVGALLLVIRLTGNEPEIKLLLESVLTCIIAPCATAAPVVTGKLGGNVSTMVTYTLISSIAVSLLIPLVFPLLEKANDITFAAAFLVILKRLSLVLVLPLVLAYSIRHGLPRLHRWIISRPNLGFYTWSFSLSITTGITVKNIVNSEASSLLLWLIAAASFVVCWLQFGIGRLVGHCYNESINAGQGMFQKNTALSIWVSYAYLHPVASVGAGCYVLWQNIINSLELWAYRKKQQ